MGLWSWLTGGESAAKQQPKPREQPKAKRSSLHTVECEKCSERYEIGVDAVIFTDSATPDRVRHCDYEKVPAENLPKIERDNQLAISGRHSREWECEKCKYVQKYQGKPNRQKLFFAIYITLSLLSLAAFLIMLVVLVRCLLFETPWQPAAYAAISGVILIFVAFLFLYLAESILPTAKERLGWDLDKYATMLVALVGKPEPLKETGLERNKDYVKELGKEIDSKWGFGGMQEACEFVRIRKGPSATSDLGRIWHGIGQWRR